MATLLMVLLLLCALLMWAASLLLTTYTVYFFLARKFGMPRIAGSLAIAHAILAVVPNVYCRVVSLAIVLGVVLITWRGGPPLWKKAKAKLSSMLTAVQQASVQREVEAAA